MDWIGLAVAVLGSSALGGAITAWISKRSKSEKEASAADTITGASQKLVADIMGALDRVQAELVKRTLELADCQDELRETRRDAAR